MSLPQAEIRVLELVFSLPPAGLRRNHERNPFLMNALKDEYSEQMHWESKTAANAALRGWKRWESPIAVEVLWQQTGEGDVDNCLSSLKPLFDNLGTAPLTKAGANRYYLGIFENDSQIRRICIERERVPKKAQEGVVVRLRAEADRVERNP